MDITARCRGDVNYIMKALERRGLVTATLESKCSNVKTYNSFYTWELTKSFEDIVKSELRTLISKAFNGDTKLFQHIANEL